MSLPPEYVGKFPHVRADGFCGTFHVWACVDPVFGEMESIYVSNSESIAYAVGPLLQKNCILSVHLAAWRFAEGACEDGMVIEPDPSGQTQSMVITLEDYRGR